MPKPVTVYNYTGGYKGLLTGTLTAQISSYGTTLPTFLYSVMYYDNRGRLIQTKSNNHLSGGIEKEYIAYSFTGQPTQRKHIHTKNASSEGKQTEIYTYTYDHARRLLKTTHQLTDGVIIKPQVTLSENSYDELGRLKTNKKGEQANLNTTYTYNVRSWTNNITNMHFNEALTYSYNGNISSMQWGQAGKTRKYNFTYDNLSRLKGATYTGDGNFNTTYSYDKHGNMMTMQRYGLTAAATYGIIDNLAMTYTGNQMKTVNDAVADIALNTSMDFKNYSNVAVEYTYNKNGAMTQDLNKGISQIVYNSLNLPQIVDIKNKTTEGRNEYTYSASGQKLRAVQKWNPNYSTSPVIGSTINTAALTQSQTTDYAGNIIYENNVLKRILVDGGYYESGNYYFYIQDHLGNNRIVTDAAASVVQSTQYYPFGTSFADASGTSSQPYKYNGKELDARNGVNMYDYSARWKADWYFSTVDPMAEMYYSWSPYVYCFNNPLKYTDPTGESAVVRITNDSTVTVSSNLIMYGSKGSSELATSTAKAIQDHWNAVRGKVTIDGKEYNVVFSVTGSYSADLKAEDIISNTNYANNYIRVEDSYEVDGKNFGSSFIEGVGANAGVFLAGDMNKSKTTTSHEWGHIMGLDEGPLNMIGKGQPSIMSQRGAWVDPEYQYDSKALPGKPGGTVNPNMRVVTQGDINNLGIGKLKFSNKSATLGRITNRFF